MKSSSSSNTKNNQAAASQPFDLAQYPDRVFVGGFCEKTTEEELTEFFEQYAQVRECNIIRSENLEIDAYKRFYSFITLGNAEQAEFVKKLPAEKLVFKKNRLHVCTALRRIPRTTKPHYSECFGYACITPTDYYPPGTFTFSPYKEPHFMRRPLAEPYSQKKSLQNVSEDSENDTSKDLPPNVDGAEGKRGPETREPNNNALMTKTRQQPPTMFPYSYMPTPSFPPMLNQTSVNVMGIPEHLPPPGLISPEIYNQMRNIHLAGGDRPSFSPIRPGNYSRQPDHPRQISPETGEEKPQKKSINDSRGSDIHVSGDSLLPAPKGRNKTYSSSSRSKERRPSLEDIKAELLLKKIDQMLDSTNNEVDDSDDVFANK